MEKSDIFLLVDITLVCCDIDIISTATTTLSTTADLNMTISRLPDVVDYRFKMAATKPELERTFKRWEIATLFQGLPFIFSTTSDFDLKLMFAPTEIQDGGHQITGNGHNV